MQSLRKEIYLPVKDLISSSSKLILEQSVKLRKKQINHKIRLRPFGRECDHLVCEYYENTMRKRTN